MLKTELAWIAGIVDGEGCISLNRSRAKSRPDLRSDTFRLILKVTMGDRATIERLHALTGFGTVQNHAPKSEKVNASHSWICQCVQSEAVLRRIRPYLVTKAVEADIAIGFLELPSGTVGGHGGNKKIDPELAALRLGFYWRLRMAKSRWRFYAAKLKRSERSELIKLGLA